MKTSVIQLGLVLLLIEIAPVQLARVVAAPPIAPYPISYSIGDLLDKTDAVALEARIKAEVLPATWDAAAGGSGKIRYSSPDRSLLIIQTQEGHDVIRSLLEKIRRPAKK